MGFRRSTTGIILLVLIIAILFVVAIEPVGFARNYFGYCKKNGKRLSLEERLNLAIDDYLINQDIIDVFLLGKEKFDHYPSLDEVNRRFRIIRYENISEFWSYNPMCCSLIRNLNGGPEGPQSNFWSKAAGEGDGYFKFSHEIRYEDIESNTLGKFTSENSFYKVTNCGEATHKQFY